MDSSQKGHFQASNSLKSSASLKSSSSGENNENDDIKQDRTGSSKSQNSGKHFHKHFMSPTVSASSKAIVVSRKKVLGEKNESVSSFDVQFQNSKKEGQLLRPGTSEYSVRSSSEAFSASDSTDEFNTSVAADSWSVKPYDPLTNYLSPRPKYLRYKPNRHREILNRQWRHNRKEEFMKDSVDSINSLGHHVEDFLDDPSNRATPSVPNQETGFNEEEEEMEEEEEEEEEEEDEEEDDDDELEEKGCSLKGVLKFFLLLAVMGLCTSYKFSEDSSRTSPMQLQGLKDGYYISLNHSLEEIPTNLLCAGDSMIMCPLAGEAQVGFPELLKNQQSSYQDLGGKVQMVMEDSSDHDDINVRMLDSLNEQNSDHIIRVTEVDKSDTILDHPLLNVEETADSKDLDIDQMGSDLPKQEDFAENNMILDDGEMDFMDNQGVTEQDSDMVQKPDNTEENFMENAGEELNKSGTADKAGDDKIIEAKSERHVIGEAWLKLMKARQVELGQIHIASVAAFSIFAIVLASSSLVYCYINHPRTPSKAFLQPIKTETSQLEEEESSQKEKPIQSQPQSYREIECLQKKLESISLKPSTMTFSFEEIRKDVSYISQSTKVEFLGEVVIGGGKKKVSLSSSTIKKCGKTNNEAEEESSSNHPVTPKSDTASTDSPSYGSFTAEKKILKKQGAKDRSVQMITTPVRRSSRIQNRCIISPLRS